MATDAAVLHMYLNQTHQHFFLPFELERGAPERCSLELHSLGFLFVFVFWFVYSMEKIRGFAFCVEPHEASALPHGGNETPPS